jgi:hypothetical protein
MIADAHVAMPAAHVAMGAYHLHLELSPPG